MTKRQNSFTAWLAGRLREMLTASADDPPIVAYRELIASTPALSDYSRRMWLRHEHSLAEAIADDTGAPSDDIACRALLQTQDVPGVFHETSLRAAQGIRVLVDALFIRSLLVPALMHLTGPANWALPGWLDRILPRMAIEARDEAWLIGKSSYLLAT
jgi:hypothetical protein